MSRPDYGTTPPALSFVQKRWASKEAKWKHNNITYRHKNFTSDLPPDAQKKIIKSTFGFSVITPLTLTKADNDADIYIHFAPFGPQGNLN